MLCIILVLSECVQCPWALQWNEASTIFLIFFSQKGLLLSGGSSLCTTASLTFVSEGVSLESTHMSVITLVHSLSHMSALRVLY